MLSRRGARAVQRRHPEGQRLERTRASGRGPWAAIARLAEARLPSVAECVALLPRLLREELGTEAAILVARTSRAWQVLAGDSETIPALEPLPPTAILEASVRAYGDHHVVVPVRPGSLAFVITGPAKAADFGALRALGAAVDMALFAAEQREAARLHQEETTALQRVATEILSVHDIDAVLVSITHTAMNLLSADISGVFLREGDEVVMRCMVGNRSVETARVRVRAGQGLAGRVLETGQPVQVDNYVSAPEISDDFHPLARTEGIRSALGAPLIVRGDVIGVLEVWRRRRSAFAEPEVRRLVAMANLASIAIDTASLYEAQLAGLKQLERAYASLGKQVELQKQSSALQRSLIQVLLDGGGPQAITRTVANQAGCRTAILSSSLALTASYPRELVEAPLLRSEVARLRRSQIGSAPVRLRLEGSPFWLMVQLIQASGEPFGYACMLTEQEPSDALEIAIGQLTLICALHALEQRSTEEARADARDEIIWDLVQGSAEYRRAAASRAQRMNIDLLKPLRVFCFQLTGLEAIAAAEGMGQPRLEGVRRQLRAAVKEVSAQHWGPDLVSLRGDLIVAVTPAPGSAAARQFASAAAVRLAGVVPGMEVVCGVSRVVDSPSEYRVAYHEASVALKAAKRLGGLVRTTVFDDLGVIRLLLAPGEGPDLMQYVEEVIGSLIEYDRKRSALLVKTLRTYLHADCSLNNAAGLLHIHHKTLRYRLDRIEELTGLDLRHNEDRFSADLALRILEASHLDALPDAGTA